MMLDCQSEQKKLAKAVAFASLLYKPILNYLHKSAQVAFGVPVIQ